MAALAAGSRERLCARPDGRGSGYVVHEPARAGNRKVSTEIKLASEDGQSGRSRASTFG
jgi:hypothetical protein